MVKKSNIEKFANSVTRDIISTQKNKNQQLKKIKKQEEKLSYINNKYKQAQDLTLKAEKESSKLNNIIVNGIDNYKQTTIKDFITKDINKLEIAPELLIETQMPPKPNIRRANVFEKFMKTYKSKYNKYVLETKKNYSIEYTNCKEKEEKRKEQIKRIKENYNFEVESLVNTQKTLYHLGDKDIISNYKKDILLKSKYPFYFEKNIEIYYDKLSKKLVIEYLLPQKNIIPSISRYKYLKTKDEIKPINKKEKEIKNTYNEVIMSIALRSMYEVFNSEMSKDIESIVFNGYIEGVDLSTGKDKNIYIISFASNKQKFNEIDITRIDNYECLKKYFDANISIDSDLNFKEIIPKYKYDTVSNELKEIDNINLHTIDPYEFEELVTHLFNKMGYNAITTKRSNDGGIDFYFYNNDPVVNGKIIAQVKRYKENIDISKLREFESVLRNDNAMMGIFITTSNFSNQCESFASTRNIQLINGKKLHKLFKENNIKVNII